MDHATSRSIVLLNALINLFWTTLCVVPVFVFCWNHAGHRWIYASLAVSAVPYLAPRRALRLIQLNKSPKIYRQLGVPLVSHLSQDGRYVRRFMSRSHPQTSLRSNATQERMERTTYARERFHLAGAVFFTCVTIVAAVQARLAWTAFLLAANVLYNAYPVLLQQYIRLRLTHLKARKSGRQEPTASGTN